MLITSPEDRAILWREAIAHRDEERAARLRFVASDMLTELRSEFDLYSGYEDELVESVLLLDLCDLFLDSDMLSAYQSIGADQEAAGRLFALLTARLGDVAGDLDVDRDVRARAGDLHSLWRERIGATEGELYLTVAQVATRYAVTPQAVYKWIHAGKIAAEDTPGGSYRIPAGQFSRGASAGHRRDLQRRLAERTHGADMMTDEEITNALRASRRD